jgi:capsular polysaccharide biosynthesis protein
VDLRTLVRIVLRRWIVVVPTLVVALLVGNQVLTSVKPQYEAKGSLLVLCKVTPSAPLGTTTPAAAAGGCVNPYSGLEASLGKAALVFGTIMNDPGEKKAIAAQGLSSNYTVTVDPNAPILQIDAKDKRQRIAVETVKAVMAAVPQQILLREARAKVPPDQQLATDTLSTPVNGTALNASKTRALVAFIALSIAAVLSVALLVESWAQSNQNRRDRRRLRVAAPSPVPGSAVPVPSSMGANSRADDLQRDPQRDRPIVRPPLHAPGTGVADNGAAVAEGGADVVRPGASRPGRARAKPRRGGGAMS